MLLKDRRVRYEDLIPCRNAFIDTRSPGSDQKENFTIIGPGVAENPDQHVHISLPHGFNIGAARQPPGCLNSQHSHLTAEVFLVHFGQWAFRTGVDARDGEVVLGPGDLISIPTDVFRGFENVGTGLGHLYAVLGGDDPGRVLWAPQVFALAEDHGLVLLEDGSLIDTTQGQTVPADKKPMPVTTAEQIAEHAIIDSIALESIVLRHDRFPWRNTSSLARSPGVREAAIIGAASPGEGLEAGVFSTPHGFSVRALGLAPGAEVPRHRRSEEEVLFVQSGQLTIRCDDETLDLGTGDTFTTPIGAWRSFSNEHPDPCEVLVTRRGDLPAPPEFD